MSTPHKFSFPRFIVAKESDEKPPTENEPPSDISLSSEEQADEDNNGSYVRIPLGKVEFVLVYIGLLLALFLASLDETIVSTALKSIIEEFGQQGLVSWIGSAYLLTAAPMGILSGKFADIFGRKWVLVFVILVFEIGSLLCAVATSMEFLIVARSIAGIGGGGIFSLVQIVFPAEEGTLKGKLHRIDYLGSFLMLAALVCLITPLQLGGILWAWDSPSTISMFVLCPILFALFAYVECRVAEEPIVPPALFVNKSVPAILAIMIALGAVFFCGIYFLSTFFQVEYNASGMNAGMKILPAFIGLGISSVLSGFWVTRMGTYKFFFALGSGITFVGIILVSQLTAHSSLAEQIIFLAIFGLGIGCTINTRMIALQASVPRDLIAIATAVGQTCKTVGSAIGIAITGTIFNNRIAKNMKSSEHLQYFIILFNDQGAELTSTDALPILDMLYDAQADYPKNNASLAAVYNETLALATDELTTGFSSAFSVAYLCLLTYPIVIFGLSFLIEQFSLGPKKPRRKRHADERVEGV
ncbi:hypothetical protein HDU98_003293 [Podochytrium sp. JEL0797]|nr:hypothetical protein HDU98_003293 [Podochytrium sp. JEL0797]